jgi:predicted small lipoprotein YifL
MVRSMRRAVVLAALGFSLAGCGSNTVPEGMPEKPVYKTINPQEILGSTKDAYKKAKATPKAEAAPAPASEPAK